MWKENPNQLAKCCYVGYNNKPRGGFQGLALLPCQLQARSIRLVAILTSHAKLVMTQGTEYLLSDVIFHFNPPFPGPCFQDFIASEVTVSEMTQKYIPQDVITAGKDDWGKLSMSELLQEHWQVSFISWSQFQDQRFFLALWFIFLREGSFVW